MDSLALHTCCAPCLIEPLRLLREDFDAITAVYYNPNIEPHDEYERRHDALVTYARLVEVPYVELPYENAAWTATLAEAGVSTARLETPERCEHCYRMRFERVAKWATVHGFTHFATTLTVSPYQQRRVIEQVAREICARYDLVYAGRDFSEHFDDAQRRARDLGLYRQSYCGCASGKQSRET
ncbi:MAG: epoxyqueuosine reductase QueH [Coriobacteriia bacterium]|nr:epoxyqueuosine reductase QueH [Coriobacteriia bacterium]